MTVRRTDIACAIGRAYRHPQARDRPVVALVIRLNDGRTVAAETTRALFDGTARAPAASPVAEADRRQQEGRP